MPSEAQKRAAEEAASIADRARESVMMSIALQQMGELMKEQTALLLELVTLTKRTNKRLTEIYERVGDAAEETAAAVLALPSGDSIATPRPVAQPAAVPQSIEEDPRLTREEWEALERDRDFGGRKPAGYVPPKNSMNGHGENAS